MAKIDDFSVAEARHHLRQLLEIVRRNRSFDANGAFVDTPLSRADARAAQAACQAAIAVLKRAATSPTVH